MCHHKWGYSMYNNMLPIIMQGVLLGKVVKEFVFICVPHTQHSALFYWERSSKLSKWRVSFILGRNWAIITAPLSKSDSVISHIRWAMVKCNTSLVIQGLYQVQFESQFWSYCYPCDLRQIAYSEPLCPHLQSKDVNILVLIGIWSH